MASALAVSLSLVRNKRRELGLPASPRGKPPGKYRRDLGTSERLVVKRRLSWARSDGLPHPGGRGPR